MKPFKVMTMRLDSPFGPLRLVAAKGALVAVDLPNHKSDLGATAEERKDDPVLIAVARQLREYFAGTRQTFDIPLWAQGTAFQQKVWHALQQIPFGVTRSYGDVARAIRQPTASRAVGAANGKNPIAIIVPCHRVIGSTGALVGYGGGKDVKQWLLDHEARVLRGTPSE